MERRTSLQEYRKRAQDKKMEEEYLFVGADYCEFVATRAT